MRSRIKQRLLLLIPALLLLAPSWAFAGTSGTGEVLSTFTSATSGWYNSLLSVAEGIFYVLFGVDFVYLVAQWLIGGKDVHEIFTSFIKKIMTIGVFYTILLNAHELIGWVMSGFQQAGTDAAGTPHTGISWILSTGVSFFVACVKGPVKAATSGGLPGLLWNTLTTGGGLEVSVIIGAFAGLITGIMAVLALIYLALEYIAIQLEALLVGSIGVIMLGFSGSRWTAQHGEGYLKYALSVGVRFLVLTVWVAFIESTAPTIVKTLLAGVKHAGADNIPNVLSAYANVLIFVILIAWMAKKLPSIAGSIMTGSSSMSGGELLGSAVKAAALGAAAVATGGAALAAGGAAAGTGALSAAEAASGAAKDAAGSLTNSAGNTEPPKGPGDGGKLEPAVDAVPAPVPTSAQTDMQENNAIPAPLKSVQASSAKKAQPGADKRSTSTAQGVETTVNKATSADSNPQSAPGDGGGTPVQSGGNNPAETASTADADAKPAADATDHRPDAPNTPTQPVSGVSDVVPAPLSQGAGNAQGTDAGSADVSAKNPEPASVAGKDAAIGNAQLPDGAVREQRIPDAAMRNSDTSGDASTDKVVAAPAGGSGGATASPDTAKGDNVNNGKPASDVDHRSTAPNTSTQPVSGGSDDVPAPEPQKGLMDHAHDLMKNADTLEKVMGHGLNVVSPGQADTSSVTAAGIGLKHSE